MNNEEVTQVLVSKKTRAMLKEAARQDGRNMKMFIEIAALEYIKAHGLDVPYKR